MKNADVEYYIFWSGLGMWFLSFWLIEIQQQLLSSGIFLVILGVIFAIVNAVKKNEKNKKKGKLMICENCHRPIKGKYR